MRVLLMCLWLLCGVETLSAQERGWRGLVPLHSLRTDVERVLGPPTRSLSEHSVFYSTPKETVIVNFTKGLGCGIGEKYDQFRVPGNTVVSILVTPLKDVPLTELGIDESKYQKRSGGHRPEDIYYIDEQDGVSIRVFQDQVMDLTYYPGKVDAHLSCTESSKSLTEDCTGLAPSTFHSYTTHSASHEKWLLETLGIALKSDQNRTGYIFVYGGRRSHAKEARSRAARIKKYLSDVIGVPRKQLVVIDGGYRNKSEVDLYMVVGDMCRPTPTPTVDPREVHPQSIGLRSQ